LATATETIGPTLAKVTPIITGSLMPNQRVKPKDCRIETMPQVLPVRSCLHHRPAWR
jgi:hypothetical protein